MDKFRVVELAFKEIKTATGVTDAKTLVTKYLNKEIVYGELLGKIADNEKTIERLKTETETLNQESKAQEMELEVLNSVRIKSQDLHDDIKALEQIDEKSTTAERLQNRLAQWTMRQLKKLSAIDKKHLEVDSPSSLKAIADIFAKYASILEKEATVEVVGDLLSGRDDDTLSNKENERIMRVLPKKSRKNSIGEDIFDVDEEETNPQANVEEQELINNQREELIRNNEKFMREARRRKEEERKLLGDKGDKREKSPVKAPEHKKDDE